MYKQLIIARKDLNMSPGKLAAQVSHASIAFLLEKILWGKQRSGSGKRWHYVSYGYKSRYRLIP